MCAEGWRRPIRLSLVEKDACRLPKWITICCLVCMIANFILGQQDIKLSLKAFQKAILLDLCNTLGLRYRLVAVRLGSIFQNSSGLLSV